MHIHVKKCGMLMRMSHRARALDKQAPPSVTVLRGGCNKQWRRYGLRRARVHVSSSDNNKLTPPLGMPMPLSGFGANSSRGRFAAPAMPCSSGSFLLNFRRLVSSPSTRRAFAAGAHTD